MSHPWLNTIEALSWIELKRLTSDAAIRKTVKQLNVHDKHTVEKTRSLVYGVVRRLNVLDALIEKCLAPETLGDLVIGLRSYLRLFTYLNRFNDAQLESYKLSEYVLDIFEPRELRQIKSTVDLIPSTRLPFEEMSKNKRLSMKYFHPTWYVEYLITSFGESMARDLLCHVEYPNYLRLNTLKDSEGVISSLKEDGFRLTSSSLPHTYMIQGDNGLTETEAYNKGHLIIQDKASILVGEVASPSPGDLVLDVCAAPGVKTSHLAQLMKNMGRIISIDYDLRRLNSWETLVKKLGVVNAEPVHADATKPYSIPRVEADIVLVDPPCTGTGLFHKSPSSKWRLTSRSIGRMVKLQEKILENASQRLAEGGTLIYSTCSITIEENEGVIQGFLRENPGYTLVKPEPFIGDPGWNGFNAQRMYPHLHQCNGFFIAKLVKNL